MTTRDVGNGLRLVAGLFAVAGFTVSAFAAGDVSASVRVLENAPQQMVLQCQVQELRTEAVALAGGTYYQVKLPGEAPLLDAGAPELAHVARSIIVPDTGGFEVRIDADSSTYYEIPNIDVVPSKGNLLRTIDPAEVPYQFGPAYQQAGFFPGTLVTAQEPYILRELRGLVVDFFPLQYNPATHTLRVYTALTAVITPSGLPGANEIDRIRNAAKPSAAFEEIYAAQFLNYPPGGRYAALDENGEMLVICYASWLSNMQPFVDYKNSVGIPTTLVNVSTIGNTSTAIKTYIQNYYNAHNLAFVLLVGDATQVATPSAAGGAADPSYALLAGADNYPDIMVGRFSAETAAHVDIQVTKSLRYEQQQWVLQPWFKKATGIGSQYGAGQGDEGQADYVHIGEIRTWLMQYGSYTTVDEFYGTNGATAAMVTTALNAGRGVMSYCGHGSTTGWDTTGFSSSNVNALANDNMLPVIFSVACVNGQFNNTTCFAEAWLRASHNGQPSGAAATYMSSINQSWAPPMEAQDEFNLLLSTKKANTYHCFGTLCFAGSCSMMDQYGTDGANMFKTWHVFGDPSLRIVGTRGLKGDLNCDGVIDFGDINPFVLALSDPAGYAATYPNCNVANGDINGDGHVDFGDINPFVALFNP